MNSDETPVGKKFEEQIKELHDIETLDHVDYVLKYAKERNIDLKKEKRELEDNMELDGIIMGISGFISIYWESLYLLNLLPKGSYTPIGSLAWSYITVPAFIGFLYSTRDYLKNRRLVKKLVEGANRLGIDLK